MSEAAAGHTLVAEHTVYACVMGSRAFGLATESSDTDRRGVYLAPTPLFWGFEKPPTHVEGPREEEFSWELERFCHLALRANPTILECLHSPWWSGSTRPAGSCSRCATPSCPGRSTAPSRATAGGQLKQLRADVRQHGAPRWKHAMHLLRLLASSRDLLRTGALTLDVGEDREELLAVRRGEVAWSAVERRMARLAEEAEASVSGSPL